MSCSRVFVRAALYLIEDWDWTREEKVAEMWADRIPLTRLAEDLVLALASSSGLISELVVPAGAVRRVRRGGRRRIEAWRSSFDLSKVPS